MTGPWQKIPLYSQLASIKTAAKLYGEVSMDESLKEITTKPVVYQTGDVKGGQEEATKLYSQTHSSAVRDEKQEVKFKAEWIEV